MKIIHTGDIHLGSAFKNLPSEKARLRQSEIIDDFRRLCAYARDNGVAAVLIAGDLFDENRVAGSVKREVLSAIESASPVCFFYVSGNHDDEFSFGEALPKNLYTFSESHGWKTYDLGENVLLTGMDTKNFSYQTFSALDLPPQATNLVLLHGDISGGAQGQERIPASALQNKNIDYLALGHIHKPTLQAEMLDRRCRFRYCGCFEGRGFDEIGPRGVFLLEIGNGRIVNERFFSFARRETVEMQVDISPCNTYFDLETLVLSALQNVRGDNLVKLVLGGRYKPDLRKDISLLSRRLSERFFFVKIQDESRLFIDYNDYKNDVTERGEFVREVGRYAFTDEMREEILEVGLKALAGEEIDL